jgi:hypothetical protein
VAIGPALAQIKVLSGSSLVASRISARVIAWDSSAGRSPAAHREKCNQFPRCVLLLHGKPGGSVPIRLESG